MNGWDHRFPLTAGRAARSFHSRPFAGGPLGAYPRLNMRAATGRHLSVPPAAREALSAMLQGSSEERRWRKETKELVVNYHQLRRSL